MIRIFAIRGLLSLSGIFKSCVDLGQGFVGLWVNPSNYHSCCVTMMCRVGYDTP